MLHRRILLIISLSLAASWPARAGKWPMPAGGASASGDPEVLFTFDDGPHEVHSAAILDILAEHEVKAIFFWVGRRLAQGARQKERQAVVQRAVDEGHLVANHTITHPNLCQIEEREAAREIDDNSRLYEEATRLPIVLFRVPYGAKCKRLVRMLEERSLSHMHWDIDPQEWTHHDAKRAAQYVIRKLEGLEGRAIIILHDTHHVTVKALPQILEWIAAENLRRRDGGELPPIRIISGSEFIAEKMNGGITSWFGTMAKHSTTRLQTALNRLVP